MSGDGSLHQISVAIGRLEATVDMLALTVSENQEATTAEHRKVHEIVDATAGAVRGLTETVKEMKELTDDYREKRAEGRGAAKLLQVLIATVGGIAGSAATWLIQAVNVKPPH